MFAQSAKRGPLSDIGPESKAKVRVLVIGRRLFADVMANWLSRMVQDLSLDEILAGFDAQDRSVEDTSKPRILVCAPSNAGVDEIISRLLEQGFMDGNKCASASASRRLVAALLIARWALRRPYFPDIIRVGRTTSVRS